MEIEIRPAHDLDICADVIRRSFLTIAGEFGITRSNAPTNPAFIDADTLRGMERKGIEMFGAYEGDRCVGFAAVERSDRQVFYLEKLAVLPECRHRGFGRMLVDHALCIAAKKGGRKISIGIIDENTVLKEWYKKLGFKETETRCFEHLPFTVCFMEKEI